MEMYILYLFDVYNALLLFNLMIHISHVSNCYTFTYT